MTTTLVKNVAIETDGDGQAVVCIHGLGGSSNNWTPVLSAFEGMQVVRPDLPGSARSALPSQPLSIDLYVETLARVLGELGVAKARLVRAGDPHAIRHNPAAIVLGGRMARISDDLLAGIRAVVYNRALPLATRSL
ncbi:alpha/beta fold hydrolase [Paraburkholderia sp. MM5482-R1]|uniref:alpha/beta fold hydrolase n=1 Tax=unclassified Paraburkholderia TaxID=2615204 RepID=UPI003D2135B7